LIVLGTSDETIQEMSADIARYVNSLTKEENKERLKVFRSADRIYCS